MWYGTLALTVPVLLHGLYDLPLLILGGANAASVSLGAETSLALGTLFSSSLLGGSLWAYWLCRDFSERRGTL